MTAIFFIEFSNLFRNSVFVSQSPDCVEKSLIRVCDVLMKPWACDRITMFFSDSTTQKLRSRKNLITGQFLGIYRVFQFRSFGWSSSCQ
jgi:hypothetical protein